MSKRRSLQELLGPAAGEAPAPARSALPSRGDGRGGDLAFGGAYEGASRLNREIALWTPQLRSADAEIFPERETAVARARDAARNDAYIKEGENLHRDGVVGSMFLLNAKPNVVALGIQDEVWEQEFQDEVESKFTLWAESPDNWVDASRMNTLTGLVRLAVGVYLASGEVLATCEWIKAWDRPYYTAMQMIDSERLSNPNHGIAMDSNIRDGVRKDKYGAPISYFIRDSHPSDIPQVPSNNWTWTEFPARMRWGRQRVLHIVDQQRIDQTRGISDIVQALKEIKTTKNFRDIMLQNAVINATFAAAIESELPSAESFAQLGGGDDADLIAYANDYLGAVADYSGGPRSLAIDGIRIPHLYPGQKLHMHPASVGKGIGTEFEQSLLRYISAGLGVSYEELSRDFSNANYSSMKKGAVQTERRMMARKRFVADRFATSIYRLWFEEAMNDGQIETMKGRPDFYENMNKDAYTSCEWLGASKGQIDELKETQAAFLRVNNNLSTLEIELGRLGIDWRKALKQKAREKKVIDELGLTPEPDNRMANSLTADPRDDDEDAPAKKEK